MDVASEAVLFAQYIFRVILCKRVLRAYLIGVSSSMLEHLDQQAFCFFKLFAQFEYALKAMGYGRAGSNGSAEANWDRFANEVGVMLLQDPDPQVIEARMYLLEHPPKRQMWIDGAVGWAEVQVAEKSAQILFSHIRRVRNNLYHGGKFNGRWLDPDRSQLLISKSLVLLQKIVEQNGTLRSAIEGNAV
jgi:hypothetical protein